MEVKDTSNLKSKTIRGVEWSFADNIINQGITFLVGLVLARILSPDEYGLIGIITIFIAISNSIVDSGFSSALIRKKDTNDDDYNTVFIVNLIASIVLAAILFASAPLIAKFFERTELTAITRAMSSILIINALSIVQSAQLTKKIDFKTQTKISIASSAISGTIGILMAFMGCGVWSLVFQQLSRQFINTVLFWYYNKWIPNFRFYLSSFKELFTFGWKLLVSGLIDSTWNQLYQVVIGKCYSPTTLGQYSRAQQFSNLFSTNLTHIVQRVSYPSLSSIQEERERLKNAYRTVITVTMLVSFCCMFGLAAVAKPMIRVLIGSKWYPAVPFLQILCLQMVLYPLHAINLNMLQVQGRSDLFLKLEIIKKIIGTVPLLLGIFINIYWMLWSSVATGIIAYFLNSHYSGRMIGYSSFEQLKDIAPSFIIASVMGIIVLAMSYINISSFILLPIQIIAGILIVFILCEILNRKEYLEIKNIIFLTLGKSKEWIKDKI